MTLKLLITKDDQVIFEMPLSVNNWPKEQLRKEIEQLDDDIDQFQKFYDALSNEGRFRMMMRIFIDKDQTLGFGDFMRDLELNPKIVWESTRKLSEGGLLEKSTNGKYRCPQHSQARFLMVSLALRRLLRVLPENEL
jgi:hypothetical protein